LEDGVGIAEDFELVRGNGTEHAHTQARAGERLAPDDLAGQSQRGADLPHLVLEQLAQRFEQLELHALGQATDIVVRLNQRRRVVADRHALDHVRIERALSEELGLADALQRLFENLDERAPDDLALLLRIADALEFLEE